MESSENGPQGRRIYYPVSNTKQMVFDQLTTLPLNFKLVLYTCLNLLNQDKKGLKVTAADVFLEYRRVASELNIEWTSIARVKEILKNLKCLGS